MKSNFPREWRTQSKWKQRFYVRYMKWLERLGYVLVTLVIGSFIFAFNYKVDEVIKADGVTIEPETFSILASDYLRIVSWLIKPGESVREGQPLLTIVLGQENVAKFETHIQIQSLYSRTNGDSRIQELLLKNPMPPLVTVKAPTTGNFFDTKLGNEMKADFQKGQEIARVVNFSTLRLKPSLSGQSVSKANSGQSARISSIVIEPRSGIIFRSLDGNTPILSSELVSSEFKASADKQLRGKTVRVVDDIPLLIDEVVAIDLEAKSATSQAAESGRFLSLDPLASDIATGRVFDGHHSATLQISNLPKSISEPLLRDLQIETKGKLIHGKDGKFFTIDNIDDINAIIKVKASADFESGKNPLSGAIVSRTFEAEIYLESPMLGLSQAVRRAYLDGRKVTCKVEVKTGSRPLALTLLKKS